MEVDGEEYKVSNSPDEVVVIGDKEEDGATMVEEVVKETAEAKEQLPSSVPPRETCVSSDAVSYFPKRIQTI